MESVLRKYGFDKFVEEICHAFYADGIGRPGLAPGVYFRMLLIGYMEGWGSEREIAWRCNDSLALRKFSGYALTARLPDHSTLSKTRKRLSVEVHMQVFEWVLQRLKKAGLLRGKTLGIDATTLEANAVMRSIVRRDTGQKYDVFWNRWRRRRGLRRRPTRIW
ncbi:MAG: transposase [Bacteroidetes bacterium]|nr:transposase [Bacteroidota bacterium]